MPLLRKPVLKPIVGLNYMDPSTMINDRGGFPKNMRLYRNYLKKREGSALYGPGTIGNGNDEVLHIAEYPLESLSIRLLRFSKKKVEKYNTVTKSWNDITGSDFTGTIDDFFSTCVAENKIIMSNYIDAIRTYNDAGNAIVLAAVDGTVPKAKYIEYNESGYFICAFVNVGGIAYPTKVMWSDLGNIAKWGSGNYGSSILRHTPHPIRGLKNLNEFTIVYKKDAIYVGRPVDTSDIFKWDLAHTSIGLLSNRTLVSHNGKHYFMSDDDFKVFNTVRPESIADTTVQREVFTKLNRDKSNRCFAILMADYDEVWFYVVVAGDDWPKEIWKYNYRTGFWYFDTCDELTAACLYTSQAAITWDDLVGTWDHQTIRWDDGLASLGTPIAIIGDKDGYTYQYDPLLNNDNGVAIDGSWETMDFAADVFENYKRWLQLDFEAKGNSVKVYYSTDFGKTWTSIKTQTLTAEWATYRIYFDKMAQYIRFKFQNNTISETFYLRQYYPYYLFREEVNR